MYVVILRNKVVGNVVLVHVVSKVYVFTHWPLKGDLQQTVGFQIGKYY